MCVYSYSVVTLCHQFRIEQYFVYTFVSFDVVVMCQSVCLLQLLGNGCSSSRCHSFVFHTFLSQEIRPFIVDVSLVWHHEV